MNIYAKNIRKYEKNTLKGFFDLELEGLMTICGCSVHCKGSGWWIGMPSKSRQDASGAMKWEEVVSMPKERLERLRDLLMPSLKLELEELPKPTELASTQSFAGMDTGKPGKLESERDKLIESAKPENWKIPELPDENDPF